MTNAQRQKMTNNCPEVHYDTQMFRGKQLFTYDPRYTMIHKMLKGTPRHTSAQRYSVTQECSEIYDKTQNQKCTMTHKCPEVHHDTRMVRHTLGDKRQKVHHQKQMLRGIP